MSVYYIFSQYWCNFQDFQEKFYLLYINFFHWIIFNDFSYTIIYLVKVIPVIIKKKVWVIMSLKCSFSIFQGRKLHHLTTLLCIQLHKDYFPRKSLLISPPSRPAHHLSGGGWDQSPDLVARRQTLYHWATLSYLNFHIC